MADSTPGFDPATPLNTDQDVLRRVDCIVGQDSRDRRSLWVLFLSGEGVQLPVVVPIDGVPARPDTQTAGDLCGIIADALDAAAPVGSAVITLTRPGCEAVRDTDRYWFHALHNAARERGVSIRMLCLATRSGVRQLTLDDAISAD